MTVEELDLERLFAQTEKESALQDAKEAFKQQVDAALDEILDGDDDEVGDEDFSDEMIDVDEIKNGRPVSLTELKPKTTEASIIDDEDSDGQPTMAELMDESNQSTEVANMRVSRAQGKVAVKTLTSLQRGSAVALEKSWISGIKSKVTSILTTSEKLGKKAKGKVQFVTENTGLASAGSASVIGDSHSTSSASMIGTDLDRIGTKVEKIEDLSNESRNSLVAHYVATHRIEVLQLMREVQREQGVQTELVDVNVLNATRNGLKFRPARTTPADDETPSD